MDDIFLDDDELTNTINAMDGGCEGCTDETPVMISEPETTEVTPSIEPAPEVNIPGEKCCDNEMCNLTDDPVGYGKYFGTLMESVKIAWQFHLKSTKNSEHVILEEYYDDAQEIIDDIIESYQGIYGTIDNYENCICPCNKTPVSYFTELRQFTEEKRHMLSNISSKSEIMSDTDTLLSKINSTLYKLTRLVENKGRFLSFDAFTALSE